MDFEIGLLIKAEIFFWLMIQDRINTRDMMSRKNFYVQERNCVLCDELVDEIVEHLFLGCEFSQQFWWMLGLEWDSELAIVDILMANQHLHHISCFREVLTLGCLESLESQKPYHL